MVLIHRVKFTEELLFHPSGHGLSNPTQLRKMLGPHIRVFQLRLHNLLDLLVLRLLVVGKTANISRMLGFVMMIPASRHSSVFYLNLTTSCPSFMMKIIPNKGI
jgi:hypothetical protein